VRALIIWQSLDISTPDPNLQTAGGGSTTQFRSIPRSSALHHRPSLWKKMKTDLDLIDWLKKERSNLDWAKYNAAIIYRSEEDTKRDEAGQQTPAPFDAQSTFHRVKKLSRLAGRILTAFNTHSTFQGVRAQPGSDRGRRGPEKTPRRRHCRHPGNRIPGKDRKHYISLARLLSTVIRRMLIAKEPEDLEAREDEDHQKQSCVVQAIMPERFEIIIDLNLSTRVDGTPRANGSSIISKIATAEVQVRMCTSTKAHRRNSDVFARLEARAILKLA
jgi:hypothetical protein